jgi:hypothetical protein
MVSRDEILRLTDKGMAVFRHYISVNFRIGRNFLNPLYKDTKASCNIYYDRRNCCYRMKDFGNDDYSGDCFDLVGKIHGLDCKQSKDFISILEIIDRDLHLGVFSNYSQSGDLVKKQQNSGSSVKQAYESIPTPKKKSYAIVKKSFTATELKYWQQYGVTPEVLKLFKVESLKDFCSENSEGNPYCLSSTEQEPIFGYTNKSFVKIYRPFSDIRFLYGGAIGENYCFGLEQLPAKGDILFITGGEKDVMSLVAHNFQAICFNSETAAIPLNLIHKLSYRFKHLVLLYDVDKTGLESSEKQEQLLKGYGVKLLILPLQGTKQEKDISDYFRMGNNPEDLMKLFIELLDNLYNETMSILKSCEVDFRNPPPVAQMIVSVNDVPLGTQGNLLCITGGEGTGKSNYVAALIAGAIKRPEVEIDTLGVTVNGNSRNQAVLFYDTEQSEVQLYKNIAKLIQRSKRNTMPDYFKAYCLTGMSRKERLQGIIQSMDKFYYQYQGIHLVVIDGIADLIKCANDEAESIAVVEELYRLAGIYKTCIITVLHFIPNGLKLRGHLGSELQRKVAAILSIEKDNDPAISVVKALKVRDGSPLDVPIMQFTWSKEAGMHLYLGEKPKEEKDKRKENELISLARNVFSRQRYITYIDLCEQIQAILDVKERTAKSYIKFMREKEIVLKDPSNQSYFIIGHLN